MLVRMTLIGLALAILSGCKTSQTEDYSIRFSEADKRPEGTVLDAKLKQLEKLAEEYPKRSDIPYQMAGVWYQKENFRESAKSLERAIYIDPNEVKYHYHLGRVYLSMRELDPAEKEFRRAIELMPSDRYTGPHGALGYVLCQKGRWTEALAEFEACARIDPTEPNSYYYLGCVLDVLKDGDGAVANLKKYLELGGKGFRPKAAEILAGYGVAARGEETEIGEARPASPSSEGGKAKAASAGDAASDLDGLPGVIPDGPPRPSPARAANPPK